MIIDAMLITGGIYIGFLFLVSAGIADAKRFFYEPKHRRQSKVVSFLFGGDKQ